MNVMVSLINKKKIKTEYNKGHLEKLAIIC